MRVKKRVRTINELSLQELNYLASRGVRYLIKNGKIAKVTSNL